MAKVASQCGGRIDTMASLGGRAIYLKVAERKATDFSLASVALSLAWEGTQVNHARIVLGSVAPMPWRVQHAEEILLGEELSEERIMRVCERALEGAKPLRHNAYKIPLAKGLLRKGLRLVLDTEVGVSAELPEREI